MLMAVLRDRIVYLALRREVIRLATFMRFRGSIGGSASAKIDADCAMAEPSRLGTMLKELEACGEVDEELPANTKRWHKSLVRAQKEADDQNRADPYDGAVNLAYSKSQQNKGLEDKIEALETGQRALRLEMRECFKAIQSSVAELSRTQ
jgi:hypothetical protein